MKKIALALFLVPFIVSAQVSTSPEAGLTPGNPLYFIDRLSETLREFITLNQEAKARLKIKFAAERIAEIRIILEAKEVDAKGLEVAQSRLEDHLSGASRIILEQKNKGKNINKLAKELDDEFEKSEMALEASFEAQELALEEREDELEEQIKQARQAGETTKVEALKRELQGVENEKELLDVKEEEQEEALEREEERIEEEMEANEDLEDEDDENDSDADEELED